jgi:hypothetical protein
MNRINWLSLVFETIVFQVLFLILHFAYNWIPSPLIALISGTSEGVFQHMKIAFYAYTLLSLGIYLLTRTRMANPSRFFFARLAANIFLPWGVFFWYIAPAVLGQPMPSVALEIVYANCITLLVGLVFVVLGHEFESVQFSRFIQVSLFVLYILSICLFIAFTFQIPWAGFFFD